MPVDTLHPAAKRALLSVADEIKALRAGAEAAQGMRAENRAWALREAEDLIRKRASAPRAARDRARCAVADTHTPLLAKADEQRRQDESDARAWAHAGVTLKPDPGVTVPREELRAVLERVEAAEAQCAAALFILGRYEEALRYIRGDDVPGYDGHLPPEEVAATVLACVEALGEAGEESDRG